MWLGLRDQRESTLQIGSVEYVFMYDVLFPDSDQPQLSLPSTRLQK